MEQNFWSHSPNHDAVVTTLFFVVILSHLSDKCLHTEFIGFSRTACQPAYKASSTSVPSHVCHMPDAWDSEKYALEKRRSCTCGPKPFTAGFLSFFIRQLSLLVFANLPVKRSQLEQGNQECGTSDRALHEEAKPPPRRPLLACLLMQRRGLAYFQPTLMF